MEFKLTNDRNGGSLRGYFTCAPSALIKLFGHGVESDGYKVSTEWTFIGTNGNEFSLYDWKRTNLYDDPEAPSPEELMEQPLLTFHIGGVNDPTEFSEWLQTKIDGKFSKDFPKEYI